MANKSKRELKRIEHKEASRFWAEFYYWLSPWVVRKPRKLKSTGKRLV